MRFAYTDRDARPSTRSVEPHRLVHSGRYWYLVAHDLDRAAWRVFRVDRITGPHDTAARFIPRDPPDAAGLVAAAVTTAQYAHHAKVRLHASAEDAAQHFPPGTGALEATGPDQCVLTTGAYSLDDIAMHLGVLDIEFTVLEPAELRSRVEAIAAGTRPKGKQGPPCPASAEASDRLSERAARTRPDIRLLVVARDRELGSFSREFARG